MVKIEEVVQWKWNETGNHQVRGEGWHTKTEGVITAKGRRGVKTGAMWSERQGGKIVKEGSKKWLNSDDLGVKRTKPIGKTKYP